jgi:predicted dehydrogenase
MDKDRRNFLKGFGLVAADSLLLSTFPWLQSCTDEAQHEIKGEIAKIAIIGTGSRGKYHIDNILKMKNVEIVGLCDIYKPHLDEAAAKCPHATLYNDYRKLLESKDIQGVIVTCPLHLHATISIDALRAGKHVFCEKAMARTLSECKEMYNVWKQTGKVLYVGQQRLFDVKYIKAMSMIQAAEIGQVVGIRNFWYRNDNWRRPVPNPSLERLINWRLYKEYSGGLMTELACHHLQNGSWILKSLPDYVTGSGDIVYWKDGRDVFDTVSVIYHYPNGVQMTFDSIISNKFYGMDEQILGHKGTIELSKGRIYPEEDIAAPGLLQLINQIEHGIFDNVPLAGTSWVPETASVHKGDLIVPHPKTHDGSNTTGVAGDGSEEIMAAFCHAVITGKQAKNLVEEAYYAAVLSLLGLQSMEERKTLYFPDEYKIPYLS